MPENQKDISSNQTLQQNGSVAALDASEGVSGIGEPLDGAYAQRTLETPENAFGGQSAFGDKTLGKKSRKKWVIVAVVVGVLALIGIGAAVWLLQSTKDNEVATIEDTEKKEEEGDDDKDEEAELVIEPEMVTVLDVDDPLVQGVFQNFRAVPYHIMESVDFYHTLSTELSQAIKEDFVIAVIGTNYDVMRESMHSCEDTGTGCYYDAELFLTKAREMFGVDMIFTDGPIGVDGICSGSARYQSATHEVYYGGGCGGGMFPIVRHKIYHAEIMGDELRIDEAAVVSGLNFDDDPVTPKVTLRGIDDGRHIRDLELSEQEDVANNDWETWDKYRWIFQKDTAGNYVFKMLERIE